MNTKMEQIGSVHENVKNAASLGINIKNQRPLS